MVVSQYVFYYTDNTVSQGVRLAFESAGTLTRHISEFSGFAHHEVSIFYGILRGCGVAMRICQELGIPYCYMDNGYFDAVYMDAMKRKDMVGTYRIVKNATLDQYIEQPNKIVERDPKHKMRVLLLPPSPYSAFMHDTTPEDWLHEWHHKLLGRDVGVIRKKDDKTPLYEQLQGFDAVVAFNSMAVMEAIRLGKAVYTTHGIIRNADKFDTELQYFDYDAMRAYYEPKQLTLEQISKGAWV
jgi:hypothetical protein